MSEPALSEPARSEPALSEPVMSDPATSNRRILYCHCAFSRVIDDEVKKQVLSGLASSGAAFDAVPDLCELAARQDKDLERLAAGSEPVDIVACYPRAVRWLFHAAETPLAEEDVHIHNMRAESPDSILETLLGQADESHEEGAHES